MRGDPTTTWRFSWPLALSIAGALAACSGDEDAGGGASGGGSLGAAGAGGSSGSGGGHGGAGNFGGSSGTTGGGGSSGAGGAGGSSGTGGAPAAQCPDSVPEPLGDCDLALTPFICSYGDSTLPECRDQWQCQCVSQQPGVSCSWQRTGLGMECGAADAGACPASPARASDGGLAACNEAALGTRCGYDDGTICNCAACLERGGPCQPVSPPRWACSSRPENPDCPATIPNSGTECARAGLACVYDAVCGVEARCEDGRWNWMRLPCPQ